MFSNKTKKSPNQVTLKKTMTTKSASTKTKMMMMMWLVLKLWPYSLSSSSSSSCHFFWGRIQFHHLARSSLFCSKSNTKKKLQIFSENSFEMEWDREREREGENSRKRFWFRNRSRVIYVQRRDLSCKFSVTRLDDFHKVLGNKLHYKSCPTIWTQFWLF